MAIERRQGPGYPRRVLLVGWDAADWQMIHPLVERGMMPTLAGLTQRGAWGNLASIQPMLSPILWNSIATGKRAQDHGVFGFVEPDPDAGGVRTTSSTSRRCKALWNILSQCGLRSNVVGWYASHPAEPVAGVMVSNQFELSATGAEAPPSPASVHPAAWLAELAELRVLPAEIDAGAILPFVPEAAKLVDRQGHRLGKLQHLLAQTATIHAVATRLLAEPDWDFTAVYYEGIDRFGHEFMEFHPPKLDEVSEEDFRAYQHCMVGAYRFHDMMLQTLLDLAGPETTVIVMSDHGYYNDHLRPDPRPGKAGPVEWHRPFGVLAAQGPGFKPGGRLYGATLLDVAPTVLHLLGLPAGFDMPGRVLAEALDLPDAPRRIESWEEVEGPSGQHPAGLRLDPVEGREALKQLVALGYVEAPSEDAERAAADAVMHNRVSLAQSQVDARDYVGALETIRSIEGAAASAEGLRLLTATCHIALGQGSEARKVLETLKGAGSESPRIDMMLGTLAFAEGRPEEALGLLSRVALAEPRLPGLHNKLGGVYLEVGRHQQAIEAFEKALATDPDNAVALEGVARALLELGDPEAAYEKGLAAAELVHYFPRAHLTIGRALLALGDHRGAVEALELAVSQAPRLADGHRYLAGAYRVLGDDDKARQADLRASRVLA